jgi:sulfatase-modifying factor enzyme 1
MRDYRGEAVVDPLGPEDPGAGRVIRGGSWFNYARDGRAGYRRQCPPDDNDDYLGFRCARVQARAGQVSKQPGAERAGTGQSSKYGPGTVARSGAAHFNWARKSGADYHGRPGPRASPPVPG